MEKNSETSKENKSRAGANDTKVEGSIGITLPPPTLSFAQNRTTQLAADTSSARAEGSGKSLDDDKKKSARNNDATDSSFNALSEKDLESSNEAISNINTKRGSDEEDW